MRGLSLRHGAVIAAISVVSLLAAAHTSPVRQWLSGYIERLVASRLDGGALDFEALDYRLWRGDVSAKGIELAFATPDADVEIDASSIEVRWTPFGGVRVVLHQPDVRVRWRASTGAADPDPDPAAAPKGAALPGWLSRVELRGGYARVIDASRNRRLELGPIDGTVDTRAGIDSEIRVGGGAVVLGDGRVELYEAELETTGAPAGWNAGASPLVWEGRMAWEGAWLSANGRLDAIDPFAGTFDAEYSIEGATLERLDLAPGLEGAITGRGEMTFDGELSEATAELTAPELWADDLGPWNVEASATASAGSAIEARGRIEGYGGLLDVQGSFAGSDGRQRVEGTFAGFRLQPALSDATDGALSWEGSTEGRFAFETRALDPERLNGQGAIRFVPVDGTSQSPSKRDVRGAILIEASGGDFSWTSDGLEFPGGRAHVSGTLSRSREISSQFSVSVDEPSRFSWQRPDGEPLVRRTLVARGNVAGPIDDLAELRGHAALAAEELAIGANTYRVDGDVDLEDGIIRVRRVDVASADGARIRASGTLGVVEDRTSDISVLVRKLPIEAAARVLDVDAAGLVDGEARMTGTISRPSVDTRLSLSEIRFRGVPFPALELAGRLEDVQAHAVLRRTDGRDLATLQADVSGRKTSRLELELELQAVPFEPLLDVALSQRPELSNREIAVSADGRVAVEFVLDDPGAFVLSADVEEMSARFDSLQAKASPFSLEATPEFVRVEGLQVRGDGVELSLAGALMFNGDPSATLDAEGHVSLDAWSPIVPMADIRGTVRVDLKSRGTPAHPELFGTLLLEDAGWSQNGVSVTGDAKLRANGNALEIETLDVRALGGTVRAAGVVPFPWRARTTTGPSRLRFEVDAVDVARLALDGVGERDTESPTGASSTTEIRISMDGELESVDTSFSALDGSGTVKELLVVTAAARMELDAPASWSFRDGRFRHEALRLSGPATDLSAIARVDVSSGDLDWSATLTGETHLDVLEPLLPDALFVSGPARFDLEVSAGDAGKPSFNGTAELLDAQLVLDEPLLVLSELGGTFRFDRRNVVFDLESGELGSGRLEAHATVDLDGLERNDGEPVQVTLVADDVRLEYPEGLRSSLSVDLALRGSPANLVLTGDVRVQEAKYEDDISPTRELLRALRSGGGEFLREQGLAERLRLNLDVETVRDLAVENNLGTLRAEMNLVVTGTASLPELSGTIRARPGGEIVIGGNQYEIDAARVDLLRYPSRAAEVEIQASTEAGGRELILELSGPLDNLRTSLRSPSDPSVSRSDATSLLLTGRTTDEVRGQEARVLGGQAASFLGRGIAGAAEKGLGSALPVTTVSVDPTLVGRETDPGARFSLGQAVAEDLFLTYSIGLNDAEGQLWIVDYSLPREMNVRAIRAEDNVYTGALSQQIELDLYERNRMSTQVERPEIDDIRVRSVSGLEEPELLDALELEEGDRYDYWLARDDADKLTTLLQERGFLGARVDFRVVEANAPTETNGERTGAAEVDLVYTVEHGAPVRFAWSGDDPGDRVRSRFVEDWSGFLPARAMARRLAREAAFRLRSDGYPRATVTPSVADEGETLVVSIVVRLGPRAERVRLVFDGNDAVSDDELTELFPATDTPEFFELVFENPVDAREGIELLYAIRGHYVTGVTGPDASFDAATSELTVSIGVEEGGATFVRSLTFQGGDGISESARSEAFSLREGERFYLDAYVRGRGELAAAYYEAGFVDASVSAELERTGSSIDIVVNIDQGEQHRVGELRIVGARVTNEELIRSAAPFELGESLSLSKLHEMQRRLYDLGVFHSVDVRAAAGSSGERDIVVDLVERKDVRVAYGVRYNTDDRWEVTGGVNFRNVLGTARSVGFDAFVNRNDRVWRGTFHMPTLAGRPILTDFFVEKDSEREADFTSKGWKFTAQQSRALAGTGIRLQWGYSFRRASVAENVLDDPLALDLTVKRATLTASLIHDSRDSLSAPASGRLWSGTFQFSPTQLGSDLKLIRLYGQLFEFHSIGRGIVWASSYRVGIANGFDQVLLRQDRFRAGGPNSVRGYPHDGLGPPNRLTGTLIGGEGVIILNQELRVPVWGPLGAVGFVDAGNVFLDYQSINPIDLKTSVGIGARIGLPVGLIRIDWARALNPPDGFDRSRLHFSFGHAF